VLCPPQIPHDQTRARTPDRRGGKPATNRLSYGAAVCVEVYPCYTVFHGSYLSTGTALPELCGSPADKKNITASILSRGFTQDSNIFLNTNASGNRKSLCKNKDVSGKPVLGDVSCPRSDG
jgi:hypothetical protein